MILALVVILGLVTMGALVSAAIAAYHADAKLMIVCMALAVASTIMVNVVDILIRW